MRVLVVAEHASARFGGEAALPLHYFRILRARGIPVWLVTHSRTRNELTALFGDVPEIHYIEDTALHRLLWRAGSVLPDRVAYLTTGFFSRCLVQLEQRRLIHVLVARLGIDVIHQPMPVSPKEPSMLFGFGVPVVMGPMNGGLDYPPAFKRTQNLAERVLLRLGRANAALLNKVMPGKRLAAAMVVANDLTEGALPDGVCANVHRVVENGVDLNLWKPQANPQVPQAASETAITFVFVGRLVGWKAVELLLHAFQRARKRVPMRLWIIGDGDERANLEAISGRLFSDLDGATHFLGWLSPEQCAERMNRADCLVLPSLLECGGVVVLEAMSMAKPVIATAWGGPLDYLDETCGVLVPPKSREELIEGLARAMVDLASNPQLRLDMGERGKAKVAKEFDWERKVDRMLEIYESVLNSTNPATHAA